jgi:hypothetical protein
MIATTPRMAIHDFLLIAIAVILISLSMLPKGEARQTLVIRDPSGNLQTYSLNASDPRLASLRRKLTTWSRPAPNPRLSIQKWCAEVADYYAKQTEPQANRVENVVPVSFKLKSPVPTNASEAKALNAQHAHWLHLAAEARNAIAKSESEIDRLKKLAGSPPVQLGEVASGKHSSRMLVLAGVYGLCVACGFALWTHVCPSIRLQSTAMSPRQAAAPDDKRPIGGLQLEIPPKWVRLHQPTQVVIRQTAFAVVMIAGVTCAIL